MNYTESSLEDVGDAIHLKIVHKFPNLEQKKKKYIYNIEKN